MLLKYFYSQVCQRDTGGDVFKVFLFAGMPRNRKNRLKYVGQTIISEYFKYWLQEPPGRRASAGGIKFTDTTVCREIAKIDLDTPSRPLYQSIFNTASRRCLESCGLFHL